MPFMRHLSFFALFFFCTTALSTTGLANTNTITAADVFGEVELTRNGKTSRVETGTTLKTNDQVKTIGKSTVDFVWDQKVGYRMLGNTECKIKKLADGDFHIEVINGKSIFNVDKLKNPSSLQVITPTAVAGVRGTHFLVSVLNQIATFVVTEGIITLTSQLFSGGPFDLPSGKASDIGPNSTQPDVRDATQSELRDSAQASTVPTTAKPDHNFQGSDQIDDKPGAPVQGGEVDARDATVDNVGQEGDSSNDSSYP